MKREQIEAEWVKWREAVNFQGATIFIEFAQHIAKLEREECAIECDRYADQSSNPMNFAFNCAKSIRARGNK